MQRDGIPILTDARIAELTTRLGSPATLEEDRAMAVEIQARRAREKALHNADPCTETPRTGDAVSWDYGPFGTWPIEFIEACQARVDERILLERLETKLAEVRDQARAEVRPTEQDTRSDQADKAPEVPRARVPVPQWNAMVAELGALRKVADAARRVLIQWDGPGVSPMVQLRDALGSLSSSTADAKEIK